MNTETPPGATHVIPANPLDFEPRPTYMKWGYHFTGPESGKAFCCWYVWHLGQWVRDPSFSNRLNVLVRL